MLHCAIFASFWESAQKPPGGHACAARRHISVGQFWVFVFELLGGELNPPGGASCMTLF